MATKPKVLVIDDDVHFHGNAIMKMLERKINFISALTMEQARDRIADSPTDLRLVILTAQMSCETHWDDPEPDTLELIPLISARFGCPIMAVVSGGVPMIVEPLCKRMREAGCEFVFEVSILTIKEIKKTMLEVLGLPVELLEFSHGSGDDAEESA